MSGKCPGLRLLRPGLTLIESLVVVSLLSLVFGLGIRSLALRPHAQMTAAAVARVSDADRIARDLARSEGGAAIDAAGTRIRVIDVRGDLVREISLPTPISLHDARDRELARLRYSANGRCESVLLNLAGNTLKLSGLTGWISEEPQP